MKANGNGTLDDKRRGAVHPRLSANGSFPDDAKAPVEPAPLPAVGDGAKALPDTAAAPNGRDATGRFSRGNKHGHGNPFARQQAELRRAITVALTTDKIQELTAKLFSMALAGDIQAAELLLRYGIGRAGPAPNPDTLDLEEWRLLNQSPSRAQVLCALLRFVRPDLAVSAAEYGETFKDAVAEGLVASITNNPEPLKAIREILDAKHKRP